MADIPTEAVEAAATDAEREVLRRFLSGEVVPAHTDFESALWGACTAMLILRELPHLQQHVTPSEGDVQRVVAPIVAPYVSGPLDPLDVEVARAVLALLSSQPTVEDVRREVLAPMLAQADRWDEEEHTIGGTIDRGYAATVIRTRAAEASE